jgi:hypothetical protein
MALFRITDYIDADTAESLDQPDGVHVYTPCYDHAAALAPLRLPWLRLIETVQNCGKASTSNMIVDANVF